MRGTANETLARIKRSDTPIAVFRVENGIYESYWADTVETRRRMKVDPMYVGTFSKDATVRAILNIR